MSNTSQNNGIENIDKEINLLQDRLDINEKSLNRLKNGLRRIGTIKTRTKGKSF